MGGVTLLGGYPAREGTLLEGYPTLGGTQLGQHREYLLHGGRYASCVHAGGLSCLEFVLVASSCWKVENRSLNLSQN